MKDSCSIPAAIFIRISLERLTMPVNSTGNSLKLLVLGISTGYRSAFIAHSRQQSDVKLDTQTSSINLALLLNEPFCSTDFE